MKRVKNDMHFETKILFKPGEVVYERIHPSQKLIVRNFKDGLYYCEAKEAPQRKKLVFFERELIAEIKERALIHFHEPVQKKDKLLKKLPVTQMKVS